MLARARSTSSAERLRGAKPADQAFSARARRNRGGVGLRDATAKLVDSAGYGTATNAFVETHTADGASLDRGAWLQRHPPPGRPRHGRHSADFTVTAAPTPGTRMSPAKASLAMPQWRTFGLRPDVRLILRIGEQRKISTST